MNDKIPKHKLLTTNLFKTSMDFDIFPSQLKTTVTLSTCNNNNPTTLIHQSFNFIQSKANALYLGSMPDEEDLDSYNLTRSNEESGFLYYPGSPVPTFKANDLIVSNLSL